jgi:hypothetical protein
MAAARKLNLRCRALSETDLRSLVVTMQTLAPERLAEALEVLDERRRQEAPTQPAGLLTADTLERMPELLREVLHARGLSNYRAAKELGVSPAAIVLWANGARRPRFEQLIRLLRWMGE